MDYVSKPVSPILVSLRVRNTLALKYARDQLEQLSVTDSLTGLANRRRFDEYLANELERQSRIKAPLSLMILDIDYFKKFNDAYGHVAGDNCLVQVASALKRVLGRAGDLAARYGGEEFAGIMPSTEHYGAAEVAEHMRQILIVMSITHRDSAVAPYVTASIGIATLEFPSKRTPADLILLTDEQLYKAKENGRDQIVSIVFQPKSNISGVFQ